MNTGQADVIFRNAAVWTVDPFRPWAQSVAVTGNRISYVGDDFGVRELRGPRTQVFDLGGRMLLPGFISGHDHLIGSGWAKLGVDLSRARDLEEILALVGDHAGSHPEAPVVKGFGWSWNQTGLHPTAAMLDAVVPDRPVALMNADVHDCWFNTKALEAAGIGESTADCASGGHWLRDERGVPDGVAIEGAWARAYAECGAMAGETTFREALDLIMGVARRGGLTATVDMGVVTPTIVGTPPEDAAFAYRACAALDEAGEMPLRVYGTFLVHRTPGFLVPPDEAMAMLAAFHRDIRSDHVSVSALKLYADGTAPGHTGCMLDPYADEDCIDMDAVGVGTDWLASYIEPAHLAGFDVFTHCDGDGAVRRMIDACERVFRAHGRGERRHSVEHCNAVHPDDIPRMAHLGLQGNGTPAWSIPWPWRETYLRVYGERRVEERVMPYRRIHDAGVPFTLGADMPGVQPYELVPLYQITAAVTQENPGMTGLERVPGAESREWRLADAIRAYTLTGAYKMRREDELGSIAPGKLADLTVLGENLFAIDPHDIWQVPVEATMMDGRFTHLTL